MTQTSNPENTPNLGDTNRLTQKPGGHPQGADGELDSLRCHHDERRGLLISSPPQCLCEYCGNAWVYDTKPPVCPVLKKAFDAGVASVIKEHHKPQPVGDGELRKKLEKLLPGFPYQGSYWAPPIDQLIALIAAQTDAARVDQIMDDFLVYNTELNNDESELIAIRDSQLDALKGQQK